MNEYPAIPEISGEHAWPIARVNPSQLTTWTPHGQTNLVPPMHLLMFHIDKRMLRKLVWPHDTYVPLD